MADITEDKRYTPFAVRSQILALSSCVIQIYGTLLAIQVGLPPEKAMELKPELDDLSERIKLLMARLEGVDG